ncbi:putative phospholipid transfer protein [Paratrimastix pyriformis]|uniref:Phospholipid transfer protein n=1 Tax=Paratrimastix pyriformis TaxID=342808 RepID=A0ABQ8UKV4_9EUKA|nr:putative phospholipid transfer protein [Paratrimastix pyriformis]
MKMWCAFLLLCLSPAILADSVPEKSETPFWKSCGKSDKFQIDRLVVYPNPPVIGESVTIFLNGTLNSSVKSGTVDFLVKFMGVKLLNLHKDLCGQASKYKCPVPAGPFSLNETISVPKVTPQGRYSGRLSVEDESTAPLLCLDFDFMMKKPTNN